MRTWWTLLAATSLITAACGSGSDDADTTAQPPSTAPTEAPASEPTTTEPSTSEPADTDPAPTEPPSTEPPATDPPVTDPPSTPSATAAFSDDGDLGAAGNDPNISVRLLDPADWPVELTGSDTSADGVKIFELEPDGATFDEPVTVQRRLDIASFDSLDLGPHDVPLVTMLTQNDSGEYELLDDLTIMRAGPHLFVSGTTDHFSPIIVANENRMIPWVPGDGDDGIAPGDAAPFLDDILTADGPLGPVNDAPLWDDTPHDEYISGVELDEVIRRIVSEGMEPTDGAYLFPDDNGTTLPSEAAPVIDGPTLDEASGRSQRFGTSFPAVPIAFGPSAQSLLGDVETTFDLTVRAIEMVLTEEEYLALSVQVADDLADELGFRAFGVTRTEFANEVFHRAFGAYPSELHLIFADVAVPPTHTLYALSWQGGEPAPDTPIVDIREVTMTPEGATVSLGLECFCTYQHGLVAVEGELAPDLLDRANAPMIWEMVANDPYVEAAAVTNENGTLFESVITADGGPLYAGEVLLEPLIIDGP